MDCSRFRANGSRLPFSAPTDALQQAPRRHPPPTASVPSKAWSTSSDALCDHPLLARE